MIPLRFACLVNVYRDAHLRLEERCNKVLENRIAMYQVAIKVGWFTVFLGPLGPLSVP